MASAVGDPEPVKDPGAPYGQKDAPDTQPAPASGKGPAHTCDLTYRSPDCPGCMDMSPASGEGEALRELEFALGRYVSRSHAHHIATEAVAPILARLVEERDDLREKVRRVEAQHVREYATASNEAWDLDPQCAECRQSWPCPTAAALGGEKAGDGGREGK